MRFVNRSLIVALVLAIGLATLAVAQDGGEPVEEPNGEDQDDGQLLDLIVTGENGTEVSVRLSQNVDADGSVDRVLLASRDSFADAMASALMQAEGPLLLIPSELPLPGDVFAELTRLGPSEVVLLGGTGAISTEVEEELGRLGFATTRRAGATRFDTAVEIARQERPNATQAIIVRAFDEAGGNGTAAWADSIAAGALAAQLQIPILLADGNGLPPATLDYLDNSLVQTIHIIGGPAAVPESVDTQLESAGFLVARLFGMTRYETALEVARLRRLTPNRAVLVDGLAEDGWQAGFVAARHAALEGAPILPVAGELLPGSIQDYLAATSPAVLTCIDVPASICDAAGAPPGGGGDPVDAPTVTFNPESGSAIFPGENVVVGVDDPGRLTTGAASASTNCEIDAFEFLPESSGALSLTIPGEDYLADFPPPVGPIPVQPFSEEGTDDGSAAGESPDPTTSAEPVDPLEEVPDTDYPTTCEVIVQLASRDGGTFTAVANYNVVDLRPNFRTTTFRQVEDEPVTFQNLSVGLIESVEWSFGDGATSTEDNPEHTFDDAGCYVTELEVQTSLEHWFTGEVFTDVYRRTLAIDPADADEANVVFYVVDALSLQGVEGETVEMLEDGVVVDSVTTDSAGRAEFLDIPNNGADSPHETVDFQVVGEDDSFFTQTLAPGHTLCVGALVGLIGTLDVTVRNDGNAPIAEAQVTVVRDGETIEEGTTDESGNVVFEKLAEAEYEVTIEAPGFVTVTDTVEVLDDQTTLLTATLPNA